MKNVVYNMMNPGIHLSDKGLKWFKDHGVDTEDPEWCGNKEHKDYDVNMEFRTDPLLVEYVKEIQDYDDSVFEEDSRCNDGSDDFDLMIEEYDETKVKPQIVKTWDYDRPEDIKYAPVAMQDDLQALMDNHNMKGLIQYLNDRKIDVI